MSTTDSNTIRTKLETYLSRLRDLHFSDFSHDHEAVKRALTMLRHQFEDQLRFVGRSKNTTPLAWLDNYYNDDVRPAQDEILERIEFSGCAFRNPCVVPEKWVNGVCVLGPESQISDEAIAWKERFSPS